MALPIPHGPSALLIGGDGGVAIYDLMSGTLGRLWTNPDAEVNAMACHAGDLWIGFAGEEIPVEFQYEHYVGTLRGSKLEARPSFVHQFFGLDTMLYDCGMYGVFETLSGRHHIKPEEMDLYGIESILAVNEASGIAAALCLGKGNEFLARIELVRGGGLSLGKCLGRTTKFYNELPREVLVEGCLVNTILSYTISVDGVPSSFPRINKVEEERYRASCLTYPFYTALAYDETRKLLYATGDNIGQFEAFAFNSGPRGLALERRQSADPKSVEGGKSLLVVNGPAAEELQSKMK